MKKKHLFKVQLWVYLVNRTQITKFGSCSNARDKMPTLMNILKYSIIQFLQESHLSTFIWHMDNTIKIHAIQHLILDC